MKIAVNKCYGGFSLSKKVYDKLGIKWDGYGHLDDKDFGIIESNNYYAYRADPRLIKAIEEIGVDDSAGDVHASIEIVEIPDDVDWDIEDYDGLETVYDRKRRW